MVDIFAAAALCLEREVHDAEAVVNLADALMDTHLLGPF